MIAEFTSRTAGDAWVRMSAGMAPDSALHCRSGLARIDCQKASIFGFERMSTCATAACVDSTWTRSLVPETGFPLCVHPHSKLTQIDLLVESFFVSSSVTCFTNFFCPFGLSMGRGPQAMLHRLDEARCVVPSLSRRYDGLPARAALDGAVQPKVVTVGFGSFRRRVGILGECGDRAE